MLLNYFAELNVIIVFEFYCTFVCFFQSLSFFLSYIVFNYIPFNFTCFFFIIFPHCAIFFVNFYLRVSQLYVFEFPIN